MPWAKFTDKLHDNDKIGALGDAAFRLWVLAITWSNDELTDGHIPSARPIKLMALRNPRKTLAELVAAKVFHPAAHPCKGCVELRAQKGVTAPIPSGGWIIHDYHEYQKARWLVLQEREHLKAIGAKGGRSSTSGRSQLMLGEEAPRLAQRSAYRSSVPVERHAQAPRLSATLERRGKGQDVADPSETSMDIGSDAPAGKDARIKRHAQPPALDPRTPVPPYPRSDNEGAAAAESEPPIPDGPEPHLPATPRATDRSRDRARDAGSLRHVSEVVGVVVARATGRTT